MTITWLETLGNAVLHHLWQMALVYLAYQWLCAFRVSTAGNRYRVALGLQLLGLLLFVVNLVLPAALPVIYSASVAPMGSSGILQSLYRALGMAYAVFTTIALVKQWLAWQQLNRLRTIPAQKAPVHWRIFVQKHAEWLHIKKTVVLKLCAQAVPATYGWIKPVILLPVACINGLTTRQVEAVLLHELAHIKRNDFFWNLIFQLSQILLYFNPFCQMLQRHALSEAEKACDDWVIRFGYSPTEYSEALVKIARMEKNAQAAISLAATGKKSVLYTRINRLLTGKDQQRPSWKMHLVVLAIIAMLFFPGLLPLRQLAATASKKNIHALLQQYYSRFATPVSAGFVAVASPEVSASAPLGKKQPIDKWQEQSVVAAKQPALPDKVPALAEPAADGVADAETSARLATQTDENTPLFLNTGNLENMLAASPELHESKAMPAFKQLLDKLEANNCLESEEWEELVLLIEYYTELKKALLAAYEKQQGYPAVAYAKVPAADEKEILMIMYDENSGTLAASPVKVRLLPVLIQEDLAANPGKQVVLLKKKATKKKIMDL
jgi:beta-lactamase regulating signal transducer with metallopeptidase domain